MFWLSKKGTVTIVNIVYLLPQQKTIHIPFPLLNITTNIHLLKVSCNVIYLKYETQVLAIFKTHS